MLTVKTWAPKRRSWSAPWKASTTPTSSEIRPTIGSAFKPVRSICEMTETQRRRFGFTMMRPKVSTNSPKKAMRSSESLATDSVALPRSASQSRKRTRWIGFSTGSGPASSTRLKRGRRASGGSIHCTLAPPDTGLFRGAHDQPGAGRVQHLEGGEIQGDGTAARPQLRRGCIQSVGMAEGPGAAELPGLPVVTGLCFDPSGVGHIRRRAARTNVRIRAGVVGVPRTGCIRSEQLAQTLGSGFGIQRCSSAVSPCLG